MKLIFEITEKNLKFLVACSRLDKKYKQLGLDLSTAADRALIRESKKGKPRLVNLVKKAKSYAWRLMTECNMSAEQVEEEIELQINKMKGLIEAETALFIILKKRGLIDRQDLSERITE